jgi:Zn-finger protein
MIMENSYKFFSNRACKYFPCHTAPESGSFNCLFCYCPLYSLGAECGGGFKYSGVKNIKNCTDCHLPHLPEYYDTIVAKLKEAGDK